MNARSLCSRAMHSPKTRAVTRVLSGVALAGLAAACATTSDLDNLRKRASFEMNCPEDQIRVSNLDDQDEAYGVNACGQRAVYLWHCTGSGLTEDCKWVLNSRVSD